MSRKLFCNSDDQLCDFSESGNQYHHSHNFRDLQNQKFSRDHRQPCDYRTHEKNGKLFLLSNL